MFNSLMVVIYKYSSNVTVVGIMRGSLSSISSGDYWSQPPILRTPFSSQTGSSFLKELPLGMTPPFFKHNTSTWYASFCTHPMIMAFAWDSISEVWDFEQRCQPLQSCLLLAFSDLKDWATWLRLAIVLTRIVIWRDLSKRCEPMPPSGVSSYLNI